MRRAARKREKEKLRRLGGGVINTSTLPPAQLIKEEPTSAELRYNEQIAAKNRKYIEDALRPIKGPRPPTPLADQEATMNGLLYGGHYMKPAGIYPPPISRFPPTHRSADRQVWRKGRTEEVMAEQTNMFATNKAQVEMEFSKTLKKRADQVFYVLYTRILRSTVTIL